MHFPHRLQRDAPAGTIAGCALALGIVLLAIGAFPVYMTLTHDEPGQRGFFYVFGGGFGLVGLLLVYSGIHQFFAMKTPETIVEMNAPALERGATVEFFFRQPGPASLESMRANLVGEERWATYVSSSRGRKTNWHTKHLGTFNFLDHGEAEIGSMPLDVLASLEVPRDIEPTREEAGDDRRSFGWKVEVWGKVRGRADFRHAFEVTVE